MNKSGGNGKSVQWLGRGTLESTRGKGATAGQGGTMAELGAGQGYHDGVGHGLRLPKRQFFVMARGRGTMAMSGTDSGRGSQRRCQPQIV